MIKALIFFFITARNGLYKSNLHSSMQLDNSGVLYSKLYMGYNLWLQM